MIINSLNDMYVLYDLFNTGRIGELVGSFSPEAVYLQLNTNRTAVGSQEIAQVMAGWGASFEGARVTVAQVVSSRDRLGEVPDAQQCYEVDFVGQGTYIRDLPGLEGAAVAHGQQVRLPLHEVVWIRDGRIIRVHNRFDADALAGTTV